MVPVQMNVKHLYVRARVRGRVRACVYRARSRERLIRALRWGAVPSSASLKMSELRQLGRYDEAALADFDGENAEDPYEIPELTRSAAMQKAQGEMELRHRSALTSEKSALKLKTSCVSHNLDGKPVLVPVYIGAYTYGRGLYRVLVNGQTGQLIGDAPISYWKVAGAVMAGICVVAGIAVMISVCFGTGGLVLSLSG